LSQIVDGSPAGAASPEGAETLDVTMRATWSPQNGLSVLLQGSRLSNGLAEIIDAQEVASRRLGRVTDEYEVLAVVDKTLNVCGREFLRVPNYLTVLVDRPGLMAIPDRSEVKHFVLLTRD
jgi:hypothetical protein